MQTSRQRFILTTLLLNHLTRTSAQVQTVTGLAPGGIPIAVRQQWCTSEQTTCTSLCEESSTSTNSTGNTCDYNSLSYICQCIDGSAPDISQFSNSIGSLACNYQLDDCLDNATSTSAEDACHYQFICGGRAVSVVPGSDSSSSSSTTSTPKQTSTSAPTLHSTSSPSFPFPTASPTDDNLHTPSESYTWLAGLIVGSIILLAVALAILYFIKRRRRRAAEASINLKHTNSRNESSDTLWHKAELDGSQANTFAMSRSTLEDVVVELPGSPAFPVELDGSSAASEMSTASPRLVRSNAFRDGGLGAETIGASPLMPVSPLSPLGPGAGVKR